MYASGTIYLNNLGMLDIFDRIRDGRAARSRGVGVSVETGRWINEAWKASRDKKRSPCWSYFDR
jgi:hypothetical protein